jgi:hypothetical protein
VVLIKNKKQGTIWNITDEAHIKRLLDDPKHYEVVNQVKANDPNEKKGKD